jgi:DNA-binding CsgD family transcriptional regulator
VGPGGHGAARGGSRLAEHHPQQTPTALAPVRDGPVPRTHLLRAAAALLLEVIAADDPGVSVLALERDLGPGEPGWPGEPLTQSETRVLRYLPTHLGAPEIAAELYLSANTVKTHLRHLYRKLGAHSRDEAVQRAQAIGLLTASPAGRRTRAGRAATPYMNGERAMAYGHAERNLALLRQLEAETRQLLESLDQPDPEQSAWLQEVSSRDDR